MLKKLLLFALILTISSINSYADITTGLMAWWKFDEGTGTSTTADSSGNGNTGNLNNSPSWVTGKIGPYALSFSGSSQYVLANNASSLNMTGSITIAFWMNVNAWNNGGSSGVLNKKGNSDSSIGYQVYDDGSSNCNGNCGTKLNFRNVGTNQVETYLYTNSSVTTGVWAHWVVVYDSSAQTVKWYKNGSLDNTFTSINAGNMTSTDNLYIGYAPEWGGYINGTLDDVRVYNRALSATDVNQLYNYPNNTINASFNHAVFKNALIN